MLRILRNAYIGLQPFPPRQLSLPPPTPTSVILLLLSSYPLCSTLDHRLHSTSHAQDVTAVEAAPTIPAVAPHQVVLPTVHLYADPRAASSPPQLPAHSSAYPA